MHLGGTTSEEGGSFQVQASVLPGFGGDRGGVGGIEERGRGAGVERERAGGDRLVEAGEFVERELPSITFIFDKTLKHGDRGLLLRKCGGAVAAAANLAQER